MNQPKPDAIDGSPGPMDDKGFDSNDKEYWNKQVDGRLTVYELDGMSTEGWKLIAVVNAGPHFSYFFRKRRK